MEGMDMDKMMGMMEGMNFPATKQEIMDMMMNKGADDDTMNMMRKMPDKEYQDRDDVKDEMMGMM